MTVRSTQAAQGCQLDSGIDRGSQRYLNAHLLQNYGTSNLGGRRIWRTGGAHLTEPERKLGAAIALGTQVILRRREG